MVIADKNQPLLIQPFHSAKSWLLNHYCYYNQEQRQNSLKSKRFNIGMNRKKKTHKVIHEIATIKQLLKVSRLFPRSIKFHFSIISCTFTRKSAIRVGFPTKKKKKRERRMGKDAKCILCPAFMKQARSDRVGKTSARMRKNDRSSRLSLPVQTHRLINSEGKRDLPLRLTRR